MGNRILNLAEKLPKEVAEKIFAKYGEIINSVDKVEEEVKNLYEKENIPNKVYGSVK